MLSKKARMDREVFKKTLLKSRKIDGQNFSIRVRFVEKTEKSRFSAVISSKVSKKAVLRNLLKRRIYEILAKIGPKKGLFCIVYAKKTATNLNFKSINKEISELFGQIT